MSVPTNATADRLRAALSGEAADQVCREMETASARQLPANMLERRALALAANGTPAATIVTEIVSYHRALWMGREALRAGGHSQPSDAEVEAAGAVLEKGIEAAALIGLTRAAPAGRPLEVPLLVVAALLDRGLPAADVVAAMQIWLTGNANDDELRDLAGPLLRVGLTVVRAANTAPSRRSRY